MMFQRLCVKVQSLPNTSKLSPSQFLTAYHNALATAKLNSIRALSQATATSATGVKEEAKETSEQDDKPISFTKSKGFKSTPTFLNPNFKTSQESRPRFQDLSILISMSSFMLYFFYFREENDLDEALGVSLYSRIDGLEKANLLSSISYHEKNGLDSRALKERLAELEAEEEAAKAEYELKEKELSNHYVKQ